MKFFQKKQPRSGKCEFTSSETNQDSPLAPLQPGKQAPDFTLVSQNGELVTLHTFRGQPVILAFYPADWSPVCGDQLILYNEVLSLFEEFNAQLLGISVDGKWCHNAFAKDRNLQFPILSDFEPKGATACAYGVYDQERGHSERALFLIDAEGMVRWSYVSPPDVNPGANGILNALESMAGA